MRKDIDVPQAWDVECWLDKPVAPMVNAMNAEAVVRAREDNPPDPHRVAEDHDALTAAIVRVGALKNRLGSMTAREVVTVNLPPDPITKV